VSQVGIVGTTTVITGLNLGVTYQFKVRARNIYGFSAFSSAITVLAAQTPNQPSVPITYVSGVNVIIQWSTPIDNGSPIIGYKIFIRQFDNVTYTQ